MNCWATKQIQQKDHIDPHCTKSPTTSINATAPSSPSPRESSSCRLHLGRRFPSSIHLGLEKREDDRCLRAQQRHAARLRRTRTRPRLSYVRSLLWGPGAVEQKRELQSCSTECQDAYSAATMSEDIDAGRFGSIRFFHFCKWNQWKTLDFLLQRTNMIHILFFPICTLEHQVLACEMWTRFS
jgi:hypothetical protein